MTDATTLPADLDGVFPEGFYATTNFETDVCIGDAWVRVEGIEMDVGIRVGEAGAHAVPMHRVRKGDRIVVGDAGVRVNEPARAEGGERFRFMASSVSSERLKARLIGDVARAM